MNRMIIGKEMHIKDARSHAQQEKCRLKPYREITIIYHRLLEKLWGNRCFHSLLLGTHCGTSTTEGNLTVVSRFTQLYILWLGNSVVGKSPRPAEVIVEGEGFSEACRRENLNINFGSKIRLQRWVIVHPRRPPSKFPFG